MKKTILAITIICAMLFTVASVSFAANDTINACITKMTGQLRIVSSLTQCKSSEGKLSWNIAGPQGPAGVDGVGISCWDSNTNSACDVAEDVNSDSVCDVLDCQGPIGLTGLQGPEGSQGPQGIAGTTGSQGPAGINVAAGQQCAQGSSVTGFDQDGNIICSSVPYAIGDTGPAGGIVFYITDGGLHGLEAAPADQSSGEWGCYGTLIAGADGTAVGTGAQNTADIVAGCSEAGIAARIADAYTLNGHDDWFLPSKDELNLLYQQKAVVGGFAVGDYWSSTEYDSYDACTQYFPNGSQNLNDKYDTLRVRAVRAF